MAELLKDSFNETLIDKLAQEIKGQYTSFNVKKFKTAVLNEHWRDKELKQRMRHITQVLTENLPEDYRQSLQILSAITDKFEGLEALLFPDFIELNGLGDYDASVPAMEYFTRFSSAEFPVRFFLQKYPEKMMQQLYNWAESENHHVRRLASEGCRPRLPWAMAIPHLKKNPHPILPILEKLKSDESDYVRRSVANNLNDISKDHPQLILQLAKDWIGENDQTDRLIKHGLRTLLKAGNAQAMKLFGYESAENIKIRQFIISDEVKIGDELRFEFMLENNGKKLGKIRLDYAIEFLRIKGKNSTKVFKLAEGQYNQSSKVFNKQHSFRKITTRQYYPGKHQLKIIVNGLQLANKTFLVL